MKRLEWCLKIILGAFCYWVAMFASDWVTSPTGYIPMFVWRWAGFYAVDTGYDDWKSRTT